MDDADRRRFLKTVADVKRDAPFSILAYCLMGNHFHFAIRVRGIPLPVVMQRILTSYAMAFNLRHERTGHLFQARYRSCLCRDDAYFLTLRKYIHQNPIRAGFCASPEEWPWSSASSSRGRGLDELIDHGALAALDPQTAAPLEDGFDPWVEPAEEAQIRLTRVEDERRPTLDEIAVNLFGEASRKTLRQGGKRREALAMKRLLTRTAVSRGHSITEVARWLGCSVSTVHYWQRPRM